MPYKDPIKQAEAKKQWYERNKELTKKRALESKHRTKAWYREKKTQDCIDGSSLLYTNPTPRHKLGTRMPTYD